MRKKLGEVLVEKGFINADQLREALELQRRRGIRLGAALVTLEYLSESQLVACLSDVLHVPAVDLTSVSPHPEAMALVPGPYAADNELFPYALDSNDRGRRVLQVAMADPLNVRVIDELGFLTNALIQPSIARLGLIETAIRRNYGSLAYGESDHVRSRRPVRVSSDYGGEMTILRPGGGEEVVDTTTGDVKPPPKSEPMLLVDVVGGAAASATSDVTTPSPVGQVSGMFDGAGALISASGAPVSADAIVDLERKFWALMRILARKRILTREEFLAELQSDAFGPRT